MRKIYSCAHADVCVEESLKGSSVMPAVHINNFESISAAEEIIHIKPVYIYGQNFVHTFLVCAQSLTHITCINKNEAHACTSCSIEELSSDFSVTST